MNKIIQYAKNLRNNPTEAEKKLWYFLRGKNLGVKFRRQHPLGHYIADFASLEKKLVVEIDGGQHSYNTADIIRDEYFQKQGFSMLRFWNNEVVENIEGVLIKIKEQL